MTKQEKSLYTSACIWIAANDAPGDNATAEELESYLTVALASDLFGTTTAKTANYVVRIRQTLTKWD